MNSTSQTSKILSSCVCGSTWPKNLFKIQQ